MSYKSPQRYGHQRAPDLSDESINSALWVVTWLMLWPVMIPYFGIVYANRALQSFGEKMSDRKPVKPSIKWGITAYLVLCACMPVLCLVLDI
jgi:hypothetical protein